MAEIRYKNFETHHSQRSYTVFFFYTKDHADYFESRLIENEIPYERGSGKDLIRRHLFGIHVSHQLQAEVLNNQTGNLFRKPFLGDINMRNGVLIFTFIIVILALIGYFAARNG